jgi:hypothetical protein
MSLSGPFNGTTAADSIKLVASFNEIDDAQSALRAISGEGHIVTEIIEGRPVYALMAVPNWSRFTLLGLYDLPELQSLLALKALGRGYDHARLEYIIQNARIVGETFGLDVPSEWTALCKTRAS